MAHGVLHVVAEDPQVEHVADEVEPAPVDEHGGHDRARLLNVGGAAPPVDEPNGHDAPVPEEIVDLEGVEGELVNEYEDAGNDNP